MPRKPPQARAGPSADSPSTAPLQLCRLAQRRSALALHLLPRPSTALRQSSSPGRAPAYGGPEGLGMPPPGSWPCGKSLRKIAPTGTARLPRAVPRQRGPEAVPPARNASALGSSVAKALGLRGWQSPGPQRPRTQRNSTATSPRTLSTTTPQLLVPRGLGTALPLLCPKAVQKSNSTPPGMNPPHCHHLRSAVALLSGPARDADGPHRFRMIGRRILPGLKAPHHADPALNPRESTPSSQPAPEQCRLAQLETGAPQHKVPARANV